MTDFLSQLVTRSLHPETSLQPRPVSRFEQGLDPLPAPVEPSPARENNEDRAPTPPAMTIPRPILPRAEITPSAEPRPFPQQTISTQTLTPPLLAPPAEPTPIPHRGRLDTPEQVETLLQTHTIRERIIERPIFPAPILPAPLVASPPSENPPKENPIPNITPLSERSASTQPPPASIAPKAPAIKRPKPTVVTPTLRPLPVSIPTHSAPDPAPTIHVTIGRVEVRATPSTQPATPRPAKPSSVMTLDEYLQRKRGVET